MSCPNCHKRTKGKIYCDNIVCKADRNSKIGLKKWKKLSTLAKNLTK